MKKALPKRASVVIIGGGIQGLSVAFNLIEQGERDILILDAGYWQGGASGRNGTLIRPGFASAAWTELFVLTVKEWETWSRRLGYAP
jgi:sarcosine oxidase subunit beta